MRRSARASLGYFVLLWPCGVACGSSSDAPETQAAGVAGSNGTTGGKSSTTGGAANPATGGAPSTTGGRAAGGANAVGGSAGAASATGGAPSAGSSGATNSGGVSGAPPGDAGGADSGDAGDAAGGAPPIVDQPAPGDYGTRANLPSTNSEMAVAELNGKIYLLGGYPSSPAETQSVVAVYDPASDDWGFAAELPLGLHHPVAVGVGGKLYSLGGQLESGETDRTLEYDPDLDRWIDLAPMPTARGGGSGAVIDDKIYVVGGRPPGGNAFEVYDISDDEWTPLPDLPEIFPERNHLIATAIDGKVYVAGGRYSGGGFNSPMTASLDIYDPVGNSWTTGMEMPRPRGGLNGIAANGCFFVWGGEGQDIGEPNDVFPDHDVYDPTTDTWTELPDLPTPVHGVTGAAFIDGLIYMPGGGTRSGGGSGSTVFQVYRPDKTCP